MTQFARPAPRPAPLGLILALGLTLGLAGCSTRLNPMNWWGSEAEPTATTAVAAPAVSDGRQALARIVSAEMRPTRGGAILTVEAETTSQGWYDLALRRETPALAPSGAGAGAGESLSLAGGRIYSLVGRPPLEAQPAIGSQASRRAKVALFLTDRELAEAGRITVQAESNALQLRR